VIRAVIAQYDISSSGTGPGAAAYREDAFLDGQDKVTSVRAQLTLGALARGRFGSVLLFRSRFLRRRSRSASTAMLRRSGGDVEKKTAALAGRMPRHPFYVHVDRLLDLQRTAASWR
jgi:hypothetical protein